MEDTGERGNCLPEAEPSTETIEGFDSRHGRGE
jgi:hypothetical protein